MELTVEAIHQRYGDAVAEIRATHPMWSAEWWKAFEIAGEQMRREFVEFNRLRDKAIGTDEDGNLVLKSNECVDCGGIIPPTGKRGRPAKRCNKCRGIDEDES